MRVLWTVSVSTFTGVMLGVVFMVSGMVLRATLLTWALSTGQLALANDEFKRV